MTDTTASTTMGVDKNSAKEAAKTVTDSAQTAAASVQQRVQDTAEQLRRTATEQAGVAREWAQDQADVLRDTVQMRPFISIGVSAASAFAAGLVLGILLTRR